MTFTTRTYEHPAPMSTPEHPVEEHVVKKIMSTLQEVETRHRVRILYACESGSRGWGFASPDSDYDVRFLYVHDIDWYLSVGTQRDVIELPVDAVYDVSGWELRKALGLLVQGNAILFEWLSSPIVYRADPVFVERMRAVLPNGMRRDRAFHHYYQMARRNFEDHLDCQEIRLKKYLYVLRPLLAALWIERDMGPAPMRFMDLVEQLVDTPDLRLAIDELLRVKRQQNESAITGKLPVIHSYLMHELERLKASPVARTDEVTDVGALDHLLSATIQRLSKWESADIK